MARCDEMFDRYVLRTTDVDGARRFYAEAIGLEIPVGGTVADAALEVWPLHERARAAGAPPHWLGHLCCDDVEATAARLIEGGGQRLGPTVTSRDGVTFATLRDAFGAVVAVQEKAPSSRRSPVAWHQLHVRDAEGAWDTYATLFGWKQTGAIETDVPPGGHRLFAWHASSEPVGSVANTARWDGVHTHWLFYWPVDDIDAALTRVRVLGGKPVEPIDFPGVGRVCACDDPQGGAFGLIRSS